MGFPLGAALGYSHTAPEEERNIRLRKALIGGVVGSGLGAFTGALSGASEVPQALEEQFKEVSRQAHTQGMVDGIQQVSNQLRRDPALLREIAKPLSPSQREALIHELRTESLPLMKLLQQGQ